MSAIRNTSRQAHDSARSRLSRWLADADALLAELDRQDEAQRLRVLRALAARHEGAR